MTRIKESHSAITQERIIPAWLKVFMLIAALGDILLVVRGFGSSAAGLFGIPVSIVLGIALPLLLLLIFVTIWFLFFPTSRVSLLCYWFLRFIREQITVISLFGILYLLVLQISILSFRGGLVWIALIGLFVISLLLKPASLQEMPAYETLGNWSALKKPLATFRRIPLWVTQVAFSLIPVALVLFVIYFVIGSSLSNYGPYSPNNDQVGYWVWLRSFHDIGFRSGYNVPNELLPVFEFSRYGEQSPIYLYLYGALTKEITWFPALPVLVNFVLLSISIFLCLRALKLTLGQTVLAGFAILLTGPVLLYLPTTMHETLNQVIGILLAAMIAKLLLDREGVSPFGRFAIVLFVCFATLVRVSWGLILVPVLFYCLDGKLAWRAILALLLGIGFFVSAVILTSYFTPPVNDTVTQTFRDWTRDGLGVFVSMIYVQFLQMSEPRPLSPNLGTLFQMAIVAGWGIARLVHSIRAKKADLHKALGSFEMFNICNLVSLAVAGLTFYAQKNFHRAFAPAILITCLLMVKRRDYRQLTALLIVGILMFPSYLNDNARGIGNYEFIRADYTSEIPQSSLIQAEIEKYIVHDPEASNPWCNTLLIPLHYYDSRLILIPSGIGISYLINAGNVQVPLKSMYALFDRPTYETFRDTTRLNLLVSLPIGDLYQNLDANCPVKR